MTKKTYGRNEFDQVEEKLLHETEPRVFSADAAELGFAPGTPMPQSLFVGDVLCGLIKRDFMNGELVAWNYTDCERTTSLTIFND